ncbi:MAG: hypothetical protein ABSG15_05825 [FCB group bacterium]|jgi:hypothetical protein
MKKILIVTITLLIVISNLNAKTIWIENNINNLPSLTTFYNGLIEDLKLTPYYQNIKIVNDNKQLKEQKGDLVITFNGQGNSIDNVNVSYFYFIAFTVNDSKNWNYHQDWGCIFSDDYINKNSHEAGIAIIKFLDKWF